MTDTTTPGPETSKALQYIGGLTCIAMHTESALDFWVSARKQSDGSLSVNVLHPEGFFAFEIPRAECEAAAGHPPATERKRKSALWAIARAMVARVITSARKRAGA